MTITVVASEILEKEFLERQIPDYANVCFVRDPINIPADSYIVFDLLFEHTHERVSLLKPFLPRSVFINAVTETLAAIEQPFIRINAWPGFLKRKVTELAALPGQQQSVKDVFEQMGWAYSLVADCPGMVTARIIAMLINEAYFALGEKISTKEEIDIAMKLGTNYPFGPFEWSEKIGLQNIHALLLQLNKENKLYETAPLLTTEAAAIGVKKIK